MILYNKDKWLDIWDSEKYEEIRNKILNSFKDLVFVDEGHRYFVGDRELFSVSVVTHIFKKHFDSIAESKKTHRYFSFAIEQEFPQVSFYST